jgi:ribosomal protein L37AE/L43A
MSAEIQRLTAEAERYFSSTGMTLGGQSYQSPTELAWAACETCGRRTTISRDEASVVATCKDCARTIKAGSYRELLDRGVLLVPRAIAQSIIFPELLGASLVMGYNGAAEYTLIANYVAAHLGRSAQPHFLLRIYPYYFGRTQALAARQTPRGEDYVSHLAQTPAFAGFRRAKVSLLDVCLTYSFAELGSFLQQALTRSISLDAPLLLDLESIEPSDAGVLSRLSQLYNA